ncbi:MAG TPA: TIGR04086 family membrane protein [Clostridiaceae bacterium]|nr:TIGR04086 family membrane protein [Clostridiaceae bacterium]
MSRNKGISSKSAQTSKISLLSIVKAVALSYIITIPIFTVLALLITYTNFPDKFILPGVIVTTIISILIAGTSSSRNLKSNGWLNGGLVGLVYMIVLYLLSSIVFKDFSINEHVLTMTVIGILTGSIGGIIGINIRR